MFECGNLIWYVMTAGKWMDWWFDGLATYNLSSKTIRPFVTIGTYEQMSDRHYATNDGIQCKLTIWPLCKSSAEKVNNMNVNVTHTSIQDIDSFKSFVHRRKDYYKYLIPVLHDKHYRIRIFNADCYRVKQLLDR